MGEGHLDFILRFAGGPVPEEALDAATLGVWFFEHELSDAQPLHGLWEVRTGALVTTTSLRRRTRVDETVLYEGAFRTVTYSLARNLDAVCFGVAEWPAQVCRRFRATGSAALAKVPVVPPVSRRRDTVSSRDVVALTVRQAASFVARQASEILLRPQWNVGIIPSPIHELLVPGHHEVRWLVRQPRHCYVADPFGVWRDGRLVVLVEEYDHRTRKGAIGALAGTPPQTLERVDAAIHIDVHSSYPYLFQHDHQLYCVPEAGRSGEVAFYRAVDFPGSWEKAATPVVGTSVADPTVFRHGDRWWLLGTDQNQGSHEKLLAWHASELGGPWEAHSGNPLKTDVRSSRPAGTPFVHEDRLYRPAQDCSKKYGWRVVLNRVDCLSPSEFSEVPVAVIEPRGAYADGLHTLSSAGDVTLVDGRRRVFLFSEAARRVLLRGRLLVGHVEPGHGREGGRREDSPNSRMGGG